MLLIILTLLLLLLISTIILVSIPGHVTTWCVRVHRMGNNSFPVVPVWYFSDLLCIETNPFCTCSEQVTCSSHLSSIYTVEMAQKSDSDGSLNFIGLGKKSILCVSQIFFKIPERFRGLMLNFVAMALCVIPGFASANATISYFCS